MKKPPQWILNAVFVKFTITSKVIYFYEYGTYLLLGGAYLRHQPEVYVTKFVKIGHEVKAG